MKYIYNPSQENRNILLLILAWSILIFVSFTTRPLMPLDETRYLSVAWEMWITGDQLVPHLNGATYAHKPPLLFWLIQAGWFVFGVSEFFGRIVAPFFGLLTLIILQKIYVLIWPNSSDNSLLAPWVLFGTLLWTVVSTITMFDMLNAFFTTTALFGLLLSLKSKPITGWVLFSISIGLGILSKGPVIFIYILPPALIAPWWTSSKQNWLIWYLSLLGSLLGAVLIALLWAIPAGISGGSEYQAEIFWNQTVNRVQSSFAHSRPIWWYGAILPLILFPWFFCLDVWGGIISLWKSADKGIKFCLASVIPAFIILSLISGKQPHYLIPLVPFVALAITAGIHKKNLNFSTISLIPTIILLLMGTVYIGFILTLKLNFDLFSSFPLWSRSISIYFGLIIISISLIYIYIISKNKKLFIYILLSKSLVVVLFFHIFIMSPVSFAYNLKPAATFVHEAMREGRKVVFADEYHGQLHFLGRINKRFGVIPLVVSPIWGQAYPRARIIVISENPPPSFTGYVFIQPYRGRFLTVWDGNSLSAYLSYLNKENKKDD